MRTSSLFEILNVASMSAAVRIADREYPDQQQLRLAHEGAFLLFGELPDARLGGLHQLEQVGELEFHQLANSLHAIEREVLAGEQPLHR